VSDLGVIDLTMKRARHYRFRFIIKDDQTEDALSILDSEFAFYAKNELTDDDDDAVIICTTANGRILPLDIPGGQCEVTIVPGDTDELALRTHRLYVDLREVTADSDVVSVADGTLTILPVALQAIV